MFDGSRHAEDHRLVKDVYLFCFTNSLPLHNSNQISIIFLSYMPYSALQVLLINAYIEGVFTTNLESASSLLAAISMDKEDGDNKETKKNVLIKQAPLKAPLKINNNEQTYLLSRK